jgi:hypothetical protein
MSSAVWCAFVFVYYESIKGDCSFVRAANKSKREQRTLLNSVLGIMSVLSLVNLGSSHACRFVCFILRRFTSGLVGVGHLNRFDAEVTLCNFNALCHN